ncbi:exosome complex component RRP4-like isoform X2 [Oscarella lobularis]|uniref:exosome complex component RRP4-like isoform X2 n=1 Tax=Oscarella lobularis TaxID=121494 RepID=UPI003313B8DC
MILTLSPVQLGLPPCVVSFPRIMETDIVIESFRPKPSVAVVDHRYQVVTPGDVITTDTGFMRGHGTYVEDDVIKSSVAGVVERVNRLICVRPLRTRYNGDIGDVVVGRIKEIGQKRWKVDTFSRLDSILMLSSVNLPGGVLRRKSAEDELMMREYFAEGDLISAEVQSLFSDGSLSLHTRSLKYGKLTRGCMVTVPPVLVKRRKTHFHTLPCGASVILGNNGYIWIGPIAPEEQPMETWEEPESKKQPVTREERETIARLRNCIIALSDRSMSLYDTSILYTYDASLNYPVKDLLKPDVVEEITRHARDL